MVNIGKRLRKIRLAKSITQGDVERATGIKRCYISRVETGHIVPSLRTLEMWARGLEIRLCDFLFGLTCPKFGDEPVDEVDGTGIPAVDAEPILQTASQTAGQNPEMLETDNNVHNELTP